MKNKHVIIMALTFLLLLVGCKDTTPIEPRENIPEVPETAEVVVKNEEIPENVSEISLESLEAKMDESVTAITYYEFNKQYKDADGEVYGEVKLEIPQLTLRSMAAAEVNQDILNYFDEVLATCNDEAPTYEELASEMDYEGPVYGMGIDYQVTKLDDNYLCLLMDGYVYTGGAHGMPSREAFVYRMNDGAKLSTEQLFDVSEEQFTEEMTSAFSALIEETPEAYWEEAMDTVKTKSDFETAEFYLTEEGATFYFAPYDLAAYAAGYVEATIPYEQLPLKSIE